VAIETLAAAKAAVFVQQFGHERFLKKSKSKFVRAAAAHR
jgi:hypothetical protein